MAASFTRICLSLLLACVVGSCAVVDQFSNRAYVGNLNVQDALNQEVLLNIIRASRYQSFSWNPVNSVNGGTSLGLSTGLPTVTFGPNNPQPPYTITNSLSSGLTGGYTTSPLLSTNFQLGMLTPITLKTFASLSTFYPREVIFYALIAAINVRSLNTGEFARLVNDPAQDYPDIYHPYDFDEQKCHGIVYGSDPKSHLFPGTVCSYSKFRALMQTLIEEGLYTETVQYATNASAQSSATGASLLQTTQVSEGRFCFSNSLRPHALPPVQGLPDCGGVEKPRNMGGNIVVKKSEKTTADDTVIQTKTKSQSIDTETTTNALIPVRDSGPYSTPSYAGVGPIQFSFELRSPNGFLNYLGSWHNFGDRVQFNSYKSVTAERIFGNGPYLVIYNAPSAQCYSSIEYEGQTYCVPLEATHTAMLMDIAVILRNLNVQPSDLNAPFTVRLSQ